MKYLAKYGHLNEDGLVTKKPNYLKVLNFDGRPLVNIIFYDKVKQKEIFQTRQGWLEGQSYGTEPYAVRFNDILSKRKIDLSLSTPFVAKTPKDSKNFVSDGLTLFIPSDLVHYKYIGEVKEDHKKDYISFYDMHEITLDTAYMTANAQGSVPLTITFKTFLRSENTNYGDEIIKILTLFGEQTNYEFKSALEKIIDKIKTDEVISNFFYKIITKTKGERFDL